jgi:hypothetical protein
VFSAKQVLGRFGYGRLTVLNASHMAWEQILCDSSEPAYKQVNSAEAKGGEGARGLGFRV